MVKGYDELWQHRDQIFRSWYERNAANLHTLGHPGFDIVVVGWSDKIDGPAGFHFGVLNEEILLQDLDEWGASPELSDAEDANLHSIGCEIGVDVSHNNFDPVRHGIPFMEAQRRMPISYGGQRLHIVGGHIMASEVTRDGVSQRIIHRWPDEPGEPIRPEPFRRTASSIIPLNRQQRRALERQHRRH